eukprot:2913066-Pleurochrysis_carterae.AAC.1
MALRKGRGCIGRDVWEVTETCSAGVQALMHVTCRVVGRHDSDVMCSSKGVQHSEASCFGDGVRRDRADGNGTQHKESRDTAEWQIMALAVFQGRRDDII